MNLDTYVIIPGKGFSLERDCVLACHAWLQSSHRRDERFDLIVDDLENCVSDTTYCSLVRLNFTFN